MKSLHVHSHLRRWAWPLAAALLAVACGGGGGVDTGGTGSEPQTVASGPISGFGSILVHGVHFDESLAGIVDDEGVVSSREDLKLGMMVQVESGAIDTDAATGLESARAARVRFGSELRGPAQSIDSVAGTLRVLGQVVKVNRDTVFDGLPAGLADVQPGQVLEVHALLDVGPGVFIATRIEPRPQATGFKLKGTVAELDSGARTLSVGGQAISFAGLPAEQGAALANGLPVHLRLDPVPEGGRWRATHLVQAKPPLADGSHVQLEGFVSGFASVSDFRLDGVPVDAGGPGVVYKRGSSAQLADGQRLKIGGTLQAGVLVARKVDFKRAGGGEDDFELNGEIQSVDAAAGILMLRGVAVSYGAQTRFVHGVPDELRAGARVRVEGPLSVAGNRVEASTITFDVQAGRGSVARD